MSQAGGGEGAVPRTGGLAGMLAVVRESRREMAARAIQKRYRGWFQRALLLPHLRNEARLVSEWPPQRLFAALLLQQRSGEDAVLRELAEESQSERPGAGPVPGPGAAAGGQPRRPSVVGPARAGDVRRRSSIVAAPAGAAAAPPPPRLHVHISQFGGLEVVSTHRSANYDVDLGFPNALSLGSWLAFLRDARASAHASQEWAASMWQRRAVLLREEGEEVCACDLV